MKTIGVLLTNARQELNLSPEELEKKTKIRVSFINALEKEQWDKLPEFPVVYGFVRNLASALHIDAQQALALVRRDYPPKKLSISPKPDLKERFVWNPRFTFLAGIVAVFLILGGYLGYQYIQFVKPPELQVASPQDGAVITKRTVVVNGKTDPQAVIRVNNQPVLLDEYGNFSTEIEVFEGTTEIEIRAVSRSGKESIVRRKIEPNLESN